MRRIGSFFHRCSGGSSGGHSSISSSEGNFPSATTAPLGEKMKPQTHMYGTMSEDNEAKRRAVSADGYNHHNSHLRALAGDYNRTSYRSNSTVADSSIEDYVKRVKKTATYLKLVLHSRKCGGRCRLPSCVQTCRVLQHVLHCDESCCRLTGCQTTKKLLVHYQQCPAQSLAASALVVPAKELQQQCVGSGECCELQHQHPSSERVNQSDEEEVHTPTERHSFTFKVRSDDSFDSCSDSPSSSLSTPHSAFCLLCSFVAAGNAEEALHEQQQQLHRRAAATSTLLEEDSITIDNNDTSGLTDGSDSMCVEDQFEAESDSNSLVIFDEVINFSKVPFQNTHQEYSHHQYHHQQQQQQQQQQQRGFNITQHPFPLAPLPEESIAESAVEDGEPRRKVRSKSLDSALQIMQL